MMGDSASHPALRAASRNVTADDRSTTIIISSCVDPNFAMIFAGIDLTQTNARQSFSTASPLLSLSLSPLSVSTSVCLCLLVSVSVSVSLGLRSRRIVNCASHNYHSHVISRHRCDDLSLSREEAETPRSLVNTLKKQTFYKNIYIILYTCHARRIHFMSKRLDIFETRNLKFWFICCHSKNTSYTKNNHISIL